MKAPTASETKSKRPFVSKFTKGYRWEPKKIVYESTDEQLTHAGGMGNIIDLFLESPHVESFRDSLPARSSNRSFDTMQFALTVLSSFWFDHECLDDVEEFGEDPGVESKLGSVPAPRTVGDWLRDFSSTNIESLNDFLVCQALSLRKKLQPDGPIVIDMDSTSHVQRAEKMEGLAYNYKNEWCLDSLVAFDDLGFAYNMDLRAGNTFSSDGAADMIDRIFSSLRSHTWASTEKHYFRGDSAFCNEEVMRSCIRQNAKFTLTAHGNTGWEKEARSIPDELWSDWSYSVAEIEQAQRRKRKLPLIQTASLLYQPSWSDNLRFTIVIKRTWREHEQIGLFAGQGYWDHYAVLTNITLANFTPQSIMEHHQARGNSENFIREAKYGYDLKHFPCKKLSANRAYGLLALVAHNFHRAMAQISNPKKPHFSKHLRRKFTFIPGRLIRHARTLTMRIPARFMKEVNRLRQAWEAPPIIPPQIRLRSWSTCVLVP